MKVLDIAKLSSKVRNWMKTALLQCRKESPIADTSKRDTENIPLDEDIEEYFKREVLPYRSDAWIDKSKTKIGYEIPFTRVFYEYKKLEPAADIEKRIREREKSLMQKLQKLFADDE